MGLIVASVSLCVMVRFIVVYIAPNTYSTVGTFSACNCSMRWGITRMPILHLSNLPMRFLTEIVKFDYTLLLLIICCFVSVVVM